MIIVLYCYYNRDKGANDLKAHGYSNNASVAELCNQPCRDALAYNIQSNQSAPQQINYANVLNAACAIGMLITLCHTYILLS